MSDGLTATSHVAQRGLPDGDYRDGRGWRHGRFWLMALSSIAVLGVAAVAPRLRTPVAATTKSRHADPPTLAVTVAPVERHTITRTAVAYGSVVAWQELAIAAEAGGLRVVEIAVDEGERVRRGQVLLRFDTAVAAAQVAEAEAALVEAEAALQVVRSDHGHGTEPPRSGSIATQMVGQRPATARQAEARVLASRAHRAEATVRLAQTEVLAPVDGMVARRAVQLGAVPADGQELFRIVRDGRLELDAKLPELDLPALHDGQAVRVVHGDWEAQASVRAVAPTVAADTRLGLVHVTLPDAGKLRPGMFARAEIQLDPAVTDAVPEAAIVYRDDRPAVFVKEPNDRVSLRYLATGARQGGYVQVVDGLREGEFVVTSGAGFLSEGDRVAVVAAPALATR